MLHTVSRITIVALVLVATTSAGAVEPFSSSVVPHRWVSQDPYGGFDAGEFIIRGQDGGSTSVFDEPLVTDRPDFTEASSTVGKDVLQFELGYTFVYNDSELDGVITRSHGAPEMLMRYGITQAVELRLVWNYVWERTIDAGARDSVDGAEDLGIGTKIFLFDQDGIFPEASVILEMTAPTGARTNSTQRAEFGVNMLYSWSLPNDWMVGGSSGYGTDTDLGMMGTVITLDRHNRFHQSATVGVPLTEVHGFYLEYFGLYYEGKAVDAAENYINGGFTYLMTDNLQLDVRLGAGLNDAADDLFAGSGMSVRY